MTAGSVTSKSLQPQQVSLSEYIAQLLASGSFLEQFHPALLDHPDELPLGITLAKDIFLGFVKLYASAAGEIEQISLGESIEWGVKLQKVSHAMSNDRSLHRVDSAQDQMFRLRGELGSAAGRWGSEQHTTSVIHEAADSGRILSDLPGIHPQALLTS